MNPSLYPTMGAAIAAQGLIWMIEPSIGLAIWQQRAEPMAKHQADFQARGMGDQAIMEKSFLERSFAEARARYNDGRFVGSKHEAADDKPYALNSDGVMQLAVEGPMTKDVGWSSGGTSTVLTRRLMNLAERDPDVKGAVARFDTPGGSVAGTADCAEAFRSFAAKKPLYCFAEDLMASAGIWVGSACSKIYATPTSQIGSIGTISVIPDMSRMAQNMGVEVLVFTNDGAEMKGAGAPGTPITDAQKAYFRDRINALQSHFTQAIVDGRGLTAAQIKAMGARVFIAADAQQRGLIDGVCSYGDCVAALTDAAAPVPKSPKRPAPARPRAEATDTHIRPPKGTNMPNAKSILASIHNALTGENIDAEDVELSGPEARTLPAPRAGASLSEAHVGLLTACAAVGVTSAADVSRLDNRAKEGDEAKAILIADVTFQATRLLGADKAKVACHGLDILPVSMLVETRDKYRSQANANAGITGNAGATRTSAGGELPSPTPAVGANAETPDARDEAAEAREQGRAYARRMANLSDAVGSTR